jgi:hypothetical protein
MPPTSAKKTAVDAAIDSADKPRTKRQGRTGFSFSSLNVQNNMSRQKTEATFKTKFEVVRLLCFTPLSPMNFSYHVCLLGNVWVT